LQILGRKTPQLFRAVVWTGLRESDARQSLPCVVYFVFSWPKGKVADVLSDQLSRSATSTGANYREANRAESRHDFIHKIALVEKEAAETQYWLELSQEAGVGPEVERQWLLQEAGEFLAIFTRLG